MPHARRDAAEETAKIVEISQQMRTLTAVMIGLTVVHTLLAGYSLLT